MKHIIIGSRESRLAIVQARLVMDSLSSLNPNISFEIKTYKTTGDMVLDRTLDKVGGKGLFVKELEAALLRGEADILVHSFKDVPMYVDERIPIVGVTKREDERDALVLPEGKKDWDMSIPVGSSSKRRNLQLKRICAGCEVLPIRGNVLTRLSKLDSGEFGALVLAAAGLKRLGLEDRISRFFSPEEMLPAACQGVLALQARADFDPAVLTGLHHEETFLTSIAERAFVRTLDGGCSSPVAAHAVLVDGMIKLKGLYVDEDEKKLRFDIINGEACEAENLGIRLAKKMKEGGCGV